jgi:Rrf2 family protein
MKITSQEEYGLRCLLQLARADGKSLTINDIASAERISMPYVAKILAVLRQEGLIDSARGRSGGYRLSASPAEIRLGVVLRALGEPLFDDPGYCRRHAGTESEQNCIHHEEGCSLRALWLTLERWVRHALDQITLADLVAEPQRIIDILRERLAEATEQEPAAALIQISGLAAATTP